jgi:hypothetical protein
MHTYIDLFWLQCLLHWTAELLRLCCHCVMTRSASKALYAVCMALHNCMAAPTHACQPAGFECPSSACPSVFQRLPSQHQAAALLQALASTR